MSELNLDNAICQLVVKALNVTAYQRHAAAKLGVDEKTVGKWVRKFKIVKHKNKYVSKLNDYE